MQIIAFDDAGGVTFVAGPHHFAAALADFTFGQQPDGTEDRTILRSPELTCTDPGCGVVQQTSFPIIGDENAAALHIRARVAHGLMATLPAAAAAVHAARVAHGDRG
jgi:hypothetical protein